MTNQKAAATGADMVNHPAHYLQYTHEVIELTHLCGFCLGNAVKYILRANFKGRRSEDLKKAAWYVGYILSLSLDDMIEEIKPGILGEPSCDKLIESFGNPIVEKLVYACGQGRRTDVKEVHEELLRLADDGEGAANA